MKVDATNSYQYAPNGLVLVSVSIYISFFCFQNSVELRQVKFWMQIFEIMIKKAENLVWKDNVAMKVDARNSKPLCS